MRPNREQGDHGAENTSSCSGPNGEAREIEWSTVPAEPPGVSDDEFPELTAENTERLMKESAAKHKADADDRRRMRGKYAPPVGRCRVCGGRVLGAIHFPSDGRIGGPPRAGYVGRWSCETCLIVYAACPTDAVSTDSKPEAGR